MSKKIAFVGTADVHMEQWPYADKKAMQWDARYGIEQVVNYSVESGESPWLVLAGDNWNVQRPSAPEIAAMFTALEPAWCSGSRVGFVQGQHCYQPGTPWPMLAGYFSDNSDHDAIVWLQGGGLHRLPGKLRMCGLDWTPPDRLAEAFDNLPKDCDVLVAHQVWEDFMPEGQNLKPECSSKDVPKQVKLVFTGDFHSHRALTVKNKGGKPMAFLSPGPVCMQNLAEPDKKFFYVVYDDLSYESIPLLSRGCFRFMLKDENDLVNFLDNYAEQCVTPQAGVPDYIQTNMVEVQYVMSIPECYSRLHRVLDKKCHHFLKAIPMSKLVREQTPDAEPITKAMTLVEAVQRIGNVSEAARADCVRLAGCPNVEAELARLETEFYDAFVVPTADVQETVE